MPDEKKRDKPNDPHDELEDDLAVGAWVRDHLDPELDATVGKATEAGGEEPQADDTAKPTDPPTELGTTPLLALGPSFCHLDSETIEIEMEAPEEEVAEPQENGAAKPNEKPTPKSPDGRTPRHCRPRGM